MFLFTYNKNHAILNKYLSRPIVRNKNFLLVLSKKETHETYINWVKVEERNRGVDKVKREVGMKGELY